MILTSAMFYCTGTAEVERRAAKTARKLQKKLSSFSAKDFQLTSTRVEKLRSITNQNLFSARLCRNSRIYPILTSILWPVNVVKQSSKWCRRFIAVQLHICRSLNMFHSCLIWLDKRLTYNVCWIGAHNCSKSCRMLSHSWSIEAPCWPAHTPLACHSTL